jgi:hypothetical protein
MKLSVMINAPDQKEVEIECESDSFGKTHSLRIDSSGAESGQTNEVGVTLFHGRAVTV